MNWKFVIPLIVVALAVIVLPTATVEDAFTSLPLIHLLGAEGFILLIVGVMGLLYMTGLLQKISRVVHLPPHAFVLTVIALTVIYIEVMT